MVMVMVMWTIISVATGDNEAPMAEVRLRLREVSLSVTEIVGI